MYPFNFYCDRFKKSEITSVRNHFDFILSLFRAFSRKCTQGQTDNLHSSTLLLAFVKNVSKCIFFSLFFKNKTLHTIQLPGLVYDQIQHDINSRQITINPQHLSEYIKMTVNKTLQS